MLNIVFHYSLVHSSQKMLINKAQSRRSGSILLTVVAIWSLFGQSVNACKNNPFTIIFTTSVSRKATFTQREYIFEIKLTQPIYEDAIGRLSLNDENSSLATCETVQFSVVTEAADLPIYIDSETGVLHLHSFNEEAVGNRTFTFKVTVRNFGTLSIISDEAAVNLSVYQTYSDRQGKSSIKLTKRGMISGPTESSIAFYRSNTKKDSSYCLFDTWFVDSEIILRPGNHNPVIKMYGPSLNGKYYGYIKYLFTYFNGTNVAKNATMGFTNVTYINAQSLETNAKIKMTDIQPMQETEKIQYFPIQVSVPQFVASLYFVYVRIKSTLFVDICYLEYLLVDTANSNKTRNIRLISEFDTNTAVWRRPFSITPIGIYANEKTPSSLVYNFRLGIKLSYDSSAFVGNLISLWYYMASPSWVTNDVTTTIPIGSMVKPTSTAPISKYPTLTIRKIEPRNSGPMVNFLTIIQVHPIIKAEIE
ncbi:unnamed protein product [Heterobilharzia americana]|nr:unnamed protein product [Heterobilharzia americana]